MIRVVLHRNGLRITGHSGTANRGEDVVCAAVTALANALMYGLREVNGREVKVGAWQPGRIEADWPAIGPADEALPILRTLAGSFLELAKGHAEAVEVSMSPDIMKTKNSPA